MEAAHEQGSERIVGSRREFRMCRRQTEAKFDGGFEFLRVKRKAENAVHARLSEGIFPLWRDRKCDDGHFAGDSHFADLVDGFEGALRAMLKARSGKQTVGSKDHEVIFFTAGFMGEFVKANGPRGFDAGAVLADVEDHDFDQIADTAIRIANQKVERFHQFEKMQPPAGMGGMRAFLPMAKQGVCQRATDERARN